MYINNIDIFINNFKNFKMFSNFFSNSNQKVSKPEIIEEPDSFNDILETKCQKYVENENLQLLQALIFYNRHLSILYMKCSPF